MKCSDTHYSCLFNSYSLLVYQTERLAEHQFPSDNDIYSVTSPFIFRSLCFLMLVCIFTAITPTFGRHWLKCAKIGCLSMHRRHVLNNYLRASTLTSDTRAEFVQRGMKSIRNLFCRVDGEEKKGMKQILLEIVAQ